MSLASSALRRPVTTLSATLAVVLLGACRSGGCRCRSSPTLPCRSSRSGPSTPARRRPRYRAWSPSRWRKRWRRRRGWSELRFDQPERRSDHDAPVRLGHQHGPDGAPGARAARQRPGAAARARRAPHPPHQRTRVSGRSRCWRSRARETSSSIARTAEDVHARRLEQLAGVASVAVAGKPEEEIRVEVDPEQVAGPRDFSRPDRHRGAGGQRQRARRHGAPRAVPPAAPGLTRSSASPEEDPRHAGGPGRAPAPGSVTSPRSASPPPTP